MKKDLRLQQDRKLKLNRETLHILERPELGAALGGATTTAFGVSCDGSCPNCNTRNTCTSVYC